MYLETDGSDHTNLLSYSTGYTHSKVSRDVSHILLYALDGNNNVLDLARPSQMHWQALGVALLSHVFYAGMLLLPAQDYAQDLALVLADTCCHVQGSLAASPFFEPDMTPYTTHPRMNAAEVIKVVNTHGFQISILSYCMKHRTLLLAGTRGPAAEKGSQGRTEKSRVSQMRAVSFPQLQVESVMVLGMQTVSHLSDMHAVGTV